MRGSNTFTRGYVILPRADVFHVGGLPPVAREVFLCLLRQANFRDRRIHGNMIGRGQVLTDYHQIREELAWQVGARRCTYTKSQIESALKALKRATAITTAKTIRGVIVTICDYDTYQNPAAYENRDGDHGEDPTIP